MPTEQLKLLHAYRKTDNQNEFKGHRQGHKKSKSTRIKVKLKGA
jgi:hypothetical protein